MGWATPLSEYGRIRRIALRRPADSFVGQQRLERADSELVAIGPYAGGFTSGIDTPEDLARLPHGYAGGIWTNEIEWLSRSLGER